MTCRGLATICDVAEQCTGLSGICPPDAFAPSTTVCRGSAGPCDAIEYCTGTSTVCPGDARQPLGTVCRPPTGDCDAPEECDGVGTNCPADVLRPAGFECRPVAGGCDIPESCNGVTSVCPADAWRPGGFVCRPSAQPCDVQEVCSGLTNQCPPDATVPNGGAPVSACPAVANVAAYWCQGGACAIQACDAGFCDVDTAYATGCECGNPGAGAPACGSATDLGTLNVGGSVNASGRVWPARCGGNTEDWVFVSTPFGARGPVAGTPSFSVGGSVTMDLQSGACGSNTSCGSGSPVGATSYSFTDNQAIAGPSAYTGGHTTTRPSGYWIRVTRGGDWLSCGDGDWSLSGTR
jgi:hypothetical protein